MGLFVLSSHLMKRFTCFGAGHLPQWHGTAGFLACARPEHSARAFWDLVLGDPRAASSLPFQIDSGADDFWPVSCNSNNPVRLSPLESWWSNLWRISSHCWKKRWSCNYSLFTPMNNFLPLFLLSPPWNRWNLRSEAARFHQPGSS